MPIQRTRTHLGDKASEGCRLLWEHVAKTGLSQRALAKELGVKLTRTQNVLFGDKAPSLEFALLLKQEIGIPVSAWAKPINPRFRIPEAA